MAATISGLSSWAKPTDSRDEPSSIVPPAVASTTEEQAHCGVTLVDGPYVAGLENLAPHQGGERFGDEHVAPSRVDRDCGAEPVGHLAGPRPRRVDDPAPMPTFPGACHQRRDGAAAVSLGAEDVDVPRRPGRRA